MKMTEIFIHRADSNCLIKGNNLFETIYWRCRWKM